MPNDFQSDPNTRARRLLADALDFARRGVVPTDSIIGVFDRMFDDEVPWFAAEAERQPPKAKLVTPETSAARPSPAVRPAPIRPPRGALVLRVPKP